MEEEIEVKLRNHKSQPVDVVVKENLYRWSNWKILTQTHNFEKEDARTINFPGEGREGRRDGRAVSRALHLVESRCRAAKVVVGLHVCASADAGSTTTFGARHHPSTDLTPN